MNLETLRTNLLAAARSRPPRDHVPYAFEQRVLARLNAVPAPDAAALWARALWRSAAACVALALLLGVWSSLGLTRDATAAGPENFSQHFEQTMLAAVNESEEAW
jgi:hypothetical protein